MKIELGYDRTAKLLGPIKSEDGSIVTRRRRRKRRRRWTVNIKSTETIIRWGLSPYTPAHCTSIGAPTIWSDEQMHFQR